MKIVLGTPNKLSRSARVISIVDGEKVLGFAGLYPDKSRQIAFMEISDELRNHPRLIVKASRIFMRWVRESKLPTHALCDEEIKRAAEFLEHFGFKRIYKEVFSWQE